MRSNQLYIPSYLVFVFMLAVGVALLAFCMQMLTMSASVYYSNGQTTLRSEHDHSFLSRLHLVCWETADLWKFVFAYAVPEMTLSSKAQTQNSIVNLLTFLMVDVDMTDPRTLLRSQIPFLNSVDMDVVERVREDFEHVAESGPPANVSVPPVERGAGSEAMDIATFFSNQPAVFVYHTHNTEAYLPDAGVRYSEDETVGVVKVGAYLTELLDSKFGVPTLHSRNYHVWEPWWAAYTHSLVTVQEALHQHESIRYVLDIHNDGVRRKETTVIIDGMSYARLYFVVGANPSRNPNWQNNYTFALRLQHKIEQRYPNLSRGILLVEGSRYNQHTSDNALLVEVGGFENSLEEALRSTEILAEILAEIVLEDVKVPVYAP